MSTTRGTRVQVVQVKPTYNNSTRTDTSTRVEDMCISTTRGTRVQEVQDNTCYNSRNLTPQTRISTQEVQVNTCYNLQLEETMNQLQEVHGYKRYMCYNLLLTTGGVQEPDTISTTRVAHHPACTPCTACTL